MYAPSYFPMKAFSGERVLVYKACARTETLALTTNSVQSRGQILGPNKNTEFADQLTWPSSELCITNLVMKIGFVFRGIFVQYVKLHSPCIDFTV